MNKQKLRQRMTEVRRELDDKDALSHELFRHLKQWDTYQNARTVGWYVHIRDEVRTQSELRVALSNPKRSPGQRIAVPFCDGTTLQFVRIETMEDLSNGKFGILEPREVLRTDLSRIVPVNEFDMILMPGLAFDVHGGRLGYGVGHYDRALIDRSPDCQLVALAYASQIIDDIPVETHDIPLHALVTEAGVLNCHR